MSKVVLGYSVGDTSEQVAIPLRHMVVTGQTQEAGKTTTLEALATRAAVEFDLPVIAFITKRGEGSFAGAPRIAPYFRERADWQFVASVLESAMREKLKFERAWIIRASKGARTLAQVHQNVRDLMLKAKGLSADVYLTLDSYLEIVVPRVAKINFASNLEIQPGLNVLDLSDRDRFPPELQALVMRSALEWVYERCNGSVTIIPEAWEFLPQGRGSPVKLSAVELVRKGAGLKNYVWLDSQDIGGVDKEMLRSCPVWLLGVQRETNEIKRVLDNIPAGIAKPKASEIARLKRGQFFACYGDHVTLTYVQPSWMTDDQAIEIAAGLTSVNDFKPPATPAIEDDVSAETDGKIDRLVGTVESLAGGVGRLANLIERQIRDRQQIGGVSADASAVEPGDDKGIAPAGSITTVMAGDEESLYQRFKSRITREAPALLKVMASIPEIEVETEVRSIKTDGATVGGRIALMIVAGFFDTPKAVTDTARELKRTGSDPGPNTKRELERLRNYGFLSEENEGFKAVATMKKSIHRATSR